MSLVTLRDLRLAFGGLPVLDGVDLTVGPGERIALVGRNGTGKSTLLRVVNGSLAPDAGERSVRRGVRIGTLDQSLPDHGAHATVFDTVADGVGELGALLRRYHELGARVAAGTGNAMSELERVQHALESQGGWQMNQRVEAVVSRLQLDADAAFDTLSGGQKRRALLARALVIEPDLLLLDEPTNHLDLDSIRWLEEFLARFAGSVLFVTHDRVFLQRLATRIVELDRGRLTDWPGDYATYRRRKDQALAAEATAAAQQDRELAGEEVWIRQGIKARRRRNQGRVRALERLRAERRQRRERSGNVRLVVQEAERTGRLVIEAEDMGFRYDDAPLLAGVSTTILRGDKVGIIGPNGCGKSTLLRILLGELEPHTGRVRHGTRLAVAYFDQLRGRLDERRSVLDNVSGGRDNLTIAGRSRHILSYLQDFLFTPERARAPLAALSGGERSRVMLAQLFSQPANLLVLDEPTNDLDAETLELLEERLAEFGGTVLLVSHDRALLDNVVTSTLVFEEAGRIGEYVGGYSDWWRQRTVAEHPAASPAEPLRRASPRPKPRNKLGYREQRELAALPQHIEAMEAEQADLHRQLADPQFYRRAGDDIAAAQARLDELETDLATAYRRWEELETHRP